jgi:DNA polymerase III subunit beta
VKISLSQPELNRIASLAGNVVPGKSTLPILSSMLLEASEGFISLSATDLDLSITLSSEADVQAPGKVAIPAKKFSEIVRKLDAVDVVLELKGESLNVDCGKSHFVIPVQDSSDFPSLPDAKGFEAFPAPASLFKDMIRRTRYAASTDLARPSMNGVFLEIAKDRVSMVATDGHRLASIARKESMAVSEKLEAILPSKALDQLLRLLPEESDIQLGFTEKQAFFQMEGVTLFTRLIDGPFPNYKQVIPASNDKEMEVDTGSMLVATDRVSTLATNLSTKQIKLSIADNKVGLEVASPDYGKAYEEVESDFQGDSMNIGYNAVYLLDALKNIGSERVRFRLDRPDNAGILEPADGGEGEEYFCLLMPLKLSD